MKERTIKTIDRGLYCGLEERTQRVIRKRSDLEDLFNAVYGAKRPSLPKVDFRSEMVLSVSRGICPNDGYGTRMTQIRYKVDSLDVVVAERFPRVGGDHVEGPSQPYHIAIVPKTNREVNFISD